MTSGNTILPFRKPGDVEDPLTAILRDGARRLLAQAIEAEAEAFLAAEAALAAFEAGPWGQKYPAIAQSWHRVWQEVYPSGEDRGLIAARRLRISGVG